MVKKLKIFDKDTEANKMLAGAKRSLCLLAPHLAVVRLLVIILSVSTTYGCSIEGPQTDTGAGSISSNEYAYCDNINLSGITWKPISEGDGNLVVLLLNNTLPQPVEISFNGNIEVGQYIGNTNPNRPTYRFKFSGSHYTNNVILSVGISSYKILNSSNRVN